MLACVPLAPLECFSSRQVALSLPVLSNAQNHYSLNTLPNSQGEAFVLPSCRPIAWRSKLSPLKDTPEIMSVPLQKHPSFASKVKIIIFCSAYIIHSLVPLLEHVYAILVNYYLFHANTLPSLVLLHGKLTRGLFLSHDFQARIQRLRRKVYGSFYFSRRFVFKFYSPFQQCHRTNRHTIRFRFWLLRRIPTSKKSKLLCTMTRRVRGSPSPYVPVRGGRGKCNTWSSIEEFVLTVPQNFDGKATAPVSYMAHVDGVDLLKFPPDKYIHARLSLVDLVDMIELDDARPIARLHDVAVGSRCTLALLKSYVHSHRCHKCAEYVTVFSVEKSATSKHAERIHKYREKKKTRGFLTRVSVKPLSLRNQLANSESLRSSGKRVRVWIPRILKKLDVPSVVSSNLAKTVRHSKV